MSQNNIRMSGNHPRTDRLFEIGSAYRQAKVLLSAIELGVFSQLAAGPLNVSDLADRVQVHGRAARDFFDALVALGLLTRDNTGQYRNTEESDRYLDRGKPTYLGANLAQLSFSAGMLTMLTFIPIFLQSGLGQASGSAGLMMMPFVIPLFVMPQIVSRHLAHRL